MTSPCDPKTAALLALLIIACLPTLLFISAYVGTNDNLDFYQCPSLDMGILNEDLISEMKTDSKLLSAFMKDNHLSSFDFWTDAGKRLVKLRDNKPTEVCSAVSSLSSYGYNLTEIVTGTFYLGDSRSIQHHVKLRMEDDLAQAALEAKKRGESFFICFLNDFPVNRQLLVATFCYILTFRDSVLKYYMITIMLIIVVFLPCLVNEMEKKDAAIVVLTSYVLLNGFFGLFAMMMYSGEGKEPALWTLRTYRDYVFATL